MKSIVSYLSKANHEVRDTGGRFEGTFRWRWLASLWATLHPERNMHLVQGTAPQAAVVVPTERPEPAAPSQIRRAPARRPRRRPAVQRAA